MAPARRLRLAVLIVVIALLAGLGVPATRTWALRHAGWALVAEDPLSHADAIVLTVEVGLAGVLEAADLVNQGVATRVAVFAGSPDPLAGEYRKRGIRYEDNADRLIHDLKAAGISAVERMPETVAGTEDEGPALARWCASQRVGSVIVVSTSDHSRRLRRVLRRAMREQGPRVMVRVSRYSAFDPEQWWRFRSGVRIQVEEGQKLLLDVLRHPLS